MSRFTKKDVTFHKEVIADKIIEYWEPKMIVEKITAFGNIFPVTGLYKDGKNDRYKVMVGTNTPHTEEIKDFLYSIMWSEAVDKFDWELGKEKSE